MRGYFGIGIYKPKTKENVGTLWRSAYQFGAAFIFTIGARYKKQSSDTVHAYKHIPLMRFDTYDIFKDTGLYDCQKVFVEFTKNSQPLTEFQHPDNCVYLLGSEDSGFDNEVKKDMDKNIIEIPSIRTQSFNVAVAGSIVMYDRLSKSLSV